MRDFTKLDLLLTFLIFSNPLTHGTTERRSRGPSKFANTREIFFKITQQRNDLGVEVVEEAILTLRHDVGAAKSKSLNHHRHDDCSYK